MIALELPRPPQGKVAAGHDSATKMPLHSAQ